MSCHPHALLPLEPTVANRRSGVWQFTCSKEDAHKWMETLDEATRAHVEEFSHLLPCPTPDGETHLGRLKLDRVGVWACLAWLLFYLVAFRLLAFAALRRRSVLLLCPHMTLQ